MSVSRRQFLASLTALAAGSCVLDASTASESATRALRFHHLHTGEHLSVEYFGRGHYQADALAAVNHLLRDFRTGDAHPIDARLLDLLHDLSRATGSARPFEIISGYRSPVTNAMLRQKGEGVAAGSLHMEGRAVDIRVVGVRLPALRNAALALGRGGVGYYPASDFVHIDTGRVRRW